jgi:FkbM family methyltransferase
MAFALHFLRPGDLFVDVGANVGSYTILASAVVGAQVLAFEPSEESADWMRGIIEHNRVQDRVRVLRCAVGGEHGIVAFTTGLDTMNRVDDSGQRAVPMTTLDAECVVQPALIKVDVEGTEAEVLKGAVRVIEGPEPPALIVEVNSPDVVDFARRRGFVCYRYDPFTRTLESTTAHSGNGILIKNVAVAQERVRTAKAFKVRGRSI